MFSIMIVSELKQKYDFHLADFKIQVWYYIQNFRPVKDKFELNICSNLYLKNSHVLNLQKK